MKNKQQVQFDDKERSIAEQEQPAGVNYFMQKFHVPAEEVQHAINKVGSSSEALEQYFTDVRRNAPF